MRGERLKTFSILPLLLVILQGDQSLCASLDKHQSSVSSHPALSNQLEAFSDSAPDDLAEDGDLSAEHSRLVHLSPGDESFEEFLKNHPGKEADEESLAVKTARGYFRRPVPMAADQLSPAGRAIDNQRHAHAVIEGRAAKSDITDFSLPGGTGRERATDSKHPQDATGAAVYNNDRSATYKSDESATFSQGESRDEATATGFMGDDMHQSLMAKIREVSSHAFDGFSQDTSLNFGISPGEDVPTKPTAYKPVYEAPSRQPDPRPDPSQRPASLQPDDNTDYRQTSGLSGPTQYDGDYASQPSGDKDDYRYQGDYEGQRNDDHDYRNGPHPGGDYSENNAEAHGHSGTRNSFRNGEYPEPQHANANYEDSNVVGHGYEDGYDAFDPYKEAAREEEAYRAVEKETDRFGEYSRGRDPGHRRKPYPSRYEETAMDRTNSEYLYDQGDYGYQNGYQDGYKNEGSRPEGQRLDAERRGYYGNEVDARNGRHDNQHVSYYGNEEDTRRGHGDYDFNQRRNHDNDNVKSRYIGEHNAGLNDQHSYHQAISEILSRKSTMKSLPQRYRRDLEGTGSQSSTLEEPRSVHPVIHRHFKGVPVTTPRPVSSVVGKSTGAGSPTSVKGNPFEVGKPFGVKQSHQEDTKLPSELQHPHSKQSNDLSGVKHPLSQVENIESPASSSRKSSPGMTIFRGDIPFNYFLARLSKPPREGSVAAEGKKTKLKSPASSGQIHFQLNTDQVKRFGDNGHSKMAAFAPGVIHTGFVPIVSEHHVSRRALVTSSDLVTSGDPVTSDDLQPAESRHLPAYQPYYLDYERQQGRQNVGKERDPYERYLPREDDNDPYFRYAPREDIQHSHSLEQAGRVGDVVHEQYDIYGRPRQSSQGRRPQVTEDYQDYDYEDDYDRNSQDGIGYPSYDEYEEDYPPSPTENTSRRRHPQEEDGLRHNDRPSNGRHGNDHHGNPRRNGHRNVDPINDDYDYDFFNDYQDDKSDSFAGETNSEKNKQLGGNSLASKAPETPTGPQKFTPGVIQNGFVPITKSPHRINKRSLFHPTPKEDLSDVVALAKDQSHGEAQRLAENNAQHSYSRISDEDFSTKIEDAFLRPVTSVDLVASIGPATSEGSVTSDETAKKSVTSGDPVVSGDPATSDDLQPAESRHLPAYQPYYSNYERQQGRQDVEREQDPYERYLPREDDNDPYFRYAPREDIQHYHGGAENIGAARQEHIQHDLYGLGPGQRYLKRKPEADNKAADYVYDEYDSAGRQETNYPANDYYYDDHSEYPSRNPTRKQPDYDYENQRDTGSHSNRRHGDGRHGNGRQDNGLGNRYAYDERGRKRG